MDSRLINTKGNTKIHFFEKNAFFTINLQKINQSLDDVALLDSLVKGSE